MCNINLNDASKVAKALRICGFDDSCDECPMSNGIGNADNPLCNLEERAADLLEAQAKQIEALIREHNTASEDISAVGCTPDVYICKTCTRNCIYKQRYGWWHQRCSNYM